MLLTKDKNQRGFTLVELMIALSVLSIILLMASLIMIQIGKWYSKGVNASNLQNVSRNITADVTSALQFSGVALNSGSGTQSMNGVSMPVRSYCLGKVRYTFIENRKLGSDRQTNVTTNHVFWRDEMRDTSSCPPRIITASGIPTNDAQTDPLKRGYEMVANNMRVTSFNIQSIGNGVYQLDLNMAFGDDDVVNTSAGRATCRSGPGSEFCSASNLRTIINRRLQ
jgi:prepilin-type N-terminal cleavage/methylation domain-containing protein